MKNTRKQQDWNFKSFSLEAQALIIGGFLVLISFYAAYLLGGIKKPFGATMLVFPLLVVTHVLIPTVWEEIKKYLRGPKNPLRVWVICFECEIQKWSNDRQIKANRKLRRTISLGWLYS